MTTSTHSTTHAASDINITLTRQPLEPWQIRFAAKMRDMLIAQAASDSEASERAKADRQDMIDRLSAMLATGNTSR